MNHMTPTGIRGLDLYVLMPDSTWTTVCSARPSMASATSTSTLVTDMEPGVMREYMLFLSLYDGVDSLAMGIDSACVITLPISTIATTITMQSICGILRTIRVLTKHGPYILTCLHSPRNLKVSMCLQTPFFAKLPTIRLLRHGKRMTFRHHLMHLSSQRIWVMAKKTFMITLFL